MPIPERAPMTPDPSDVLGLDDPRHFELLTSAMHLLDEGRYDFAVLSLQTALEIYLERQIARLLEWRRLGSLGQVIYVSLVRNYWFPDRRLQALWCGLTGDDIKAINTQGWWAGYCLHRKLRNSIVHRGHKASKAETEASVRTTLAAMEYIQSTTYRVGVDLGRIWEDGKEEPPWHDLPAHDRNS
jgi:hypothetical protein